MLSKTKNYISLLLIFAMLMMSFSVVFASDTESTEPFVLEEKYEECYGLLQALGIVKAADIATITDETVMTRGDFVKLLVSAMNMKNLATDVQDKVVFMDVFDKELNGYVNVAYQMGITNGTGNAMFSPDDVITTDMAIVMTMRALGYSFITNSVTLQDRARTIGLTKGITKYGELKAIDGALIVYNALHAGALWSSSLTIDYQSMESDRDWLDLYYGIYHKKGLVTATEISAIEGRDTTIPGCITVGDVKVHGVPEGTEALLGYTVNVYYKPEEDRNHYVYLRTYGYDYEELVIAAEDVTNFNTSGITYNDANDKSKTKNILASAEFLYNGKSVDLSEHPLSELLLNYTKVKLLDADNNGTVDSVFIINSKNYVVESVDASRKRILCGSSKIIELKDEPDFVYVLLGTDGAPLTLDKIAKWNILTVCESIDQKYLEITVSSKNVTGMIEETGKTDKNKDYVVVNGVEYLVNPQLITDQQASVGKSGTFYLSADGIIWAVNDGQTVGGNWVWAVGLHQKSALDGDVKFGCVFGSDADFVTYEVADKVIVDGSSVKEEDLTTKLTASNFPEVMVIELNEEAEIVTIDTLTRGTNESAQSLTKRHSYTTDGNLWFNKHGKSFQGKYVMSTSATSYAFPANDKTDYENMFSVTFAHDQPPYKVDLYSTGTDTQICQMAIAMGLNKAGTMPGVNDYPVPFLRMGYAYDAETGETDEMLYYLNNANAEIGVRVSPEIKAISLTYTTRGGTTVTKTVAEILALLEKGDLIRVVTDTNGLAGIQHMYDISEKRLVQDQVSYWIMGSTYGSSAEQRYFAGTLYDMKDGYVRVINEGREANFNPVTGDGIEIHSTTTNESVSYLMSVGSNGNVKMSTLNSNTELPGVKQGVNDTMVLILSRYGNPRYKLYIDYSNAQ